MRTYPNLEQPEEMERTRARIMGREPDAEETEGE
jgi:hypothetical protein